MISSVVRRRLHNSVYSNSKFWFLAFIVFIWLRNICTSILYFGTSPSSAIFFCVVTSCFKAGARCSLEYTVAAPTEAKSLCSRETSLCTAKSLKSMNMYALSIKLLLLSGIFTYAFLAPVFKQEIFQSETLMPFRVDIFLLSRGCSSRSLERVLRTSSWHATSAWSLLMSPASRAFPRTLLWYCKLTSYLKCLHRFTFKRNTP